jgi:hypothetical protein
MLLRYVRFLDYCVDRVLLRRVVVGAMFIHRTMMEHIAGLDMEKWKDEPDSLALTIITSSSICSHRLRAALACYFGLPNMTKIIVSVAEMRYG